MGLNNAPVAVAMLIHFGAVPPHLGFARVRDIIEGQNGCLSADLDPGAFSKQKINPTEKRHETMKADEFQKKRVS